MTMKVQMTGGAMVIDLFAKAKTQIMLKHPFFATLTGYLPTVERPSAWFDALGCPRTACVDGKRIYYCREFVESLKGREKIGLLIHEALHCALGHLWRRGNRDPRLWNFACDFAANAIILNATVSKKEGGRTVEVKAFALPEGALYDPKFEGMAAEQIYDILRKEAESNPSNEYQPGQGQGQLDGHIEQPIKGESDEDDEEGKGGQAGKGRGKSKQDDEEGKGGKGQGDESGDEEAQGEGEGDGGDEDTDGEGEGKGHTNLTEDDFTEKIDEKWSQRLEQARITAKQKGKLPAALDRLVDEINDARVPWQQVVDRLMTVTARNDYDMQRADRRFIEQGFYFPDLYSEETSIEVYFDTSGSIGQGEMAAMLGELRGIARCRGIRNIRIMACDAKVQLDITVGPYDDLPESLPGGGGTSLVPPFERRKEEPSEMKTSLIIYFTDLVAGEDIPHEDPGIPVLWLWLRPQYSGSWLSKPTFGTVVEYDPMTDDPYGQAA